MIIWFIKRSECSKYVTVLERIRTYPFAIRFAIYEFNISNNITRHASCTKCAAFAVFPRSEYRTENGAILNDFISSIPSISPG